MSKKRKRKSNRSSSTTATNNDSHVDIAATSTGKQESQPPSNAALAQSLVKKGKRNKKIHITKELAIFLGRDPTQLVTRIDIINGICDYANAKGLQNPKNKREIFLDRTMRKVFRCQAFTMFTMNQYIGVHIRNKPVESTAHSEDTDMKSKKKNQNTSIDNNKRSHVDIACIDDEDSVDDYQDYTDEDRQEILELPLDEIMKKVHPLVELTTDNSEDSNMKSKKRKQNTIMDEILPGKKKTKKENSTLETAVVTNSKANTDYQKAKRTIRMATATPKAAISSSQGASDRLVWEQLNKILNHPWCKDEPSGPFKKENDLLARVIEYGITPYKFEVPLGNGVSDCVGHDRLCVVEAKDMSKYSMNYKNWVKLSKNTRKLRSMLLEQTRAKILDQTTAYATYLSQATRSDVAAYCFHNQDGTVALECLGLFRYENIKHHDPRSSKQRQNDSSRQDDNESSSERTKEVGAQPETIQGHVFDQDSQSQCQKKALEDFLASNTKPSSNHEGTKTAVAEPQSEVAGEHEKIISLTQLLQNEAIGFGADQGEMRVYAQKLFDLGLHSREMILFALNDQKRIEKVREWNWMKTFHKEVFVRWIRSKWENTESTELAFVKRRRKLQTSCILKDR